jgi:hypothetical protein
MANEFSDIEELVRNDIRRGLAGDAVGPDGTPAGDRKPDASFTPVRGDADQSRDGIVYANAITGDRGTTAVEWAFRCRHVRTFGGILPTNRELTIYGVTIVRTRGEKLEFRRYVDWSMVMTELGVSAGFRPAVNSLDEIPGFDTAQRRTPKPVDRAPSARRTRER